MGNILRDTANFAKPKTKYILGKPSAKLFDMESGGSSDGGKELGEPDGNGRPGAVRSSLGYAGV